MTGPSVELKVLFSMAAGIVAFLIAYRTGNRYKAVVIPACVAAICWMFPVLLDTKSLSAFGVIGLLVFVLLASLVFSVGAVVGCVAGILMRGGPRVQRPILRKGIAVAILVAAVMIAVMQVEKERRFRSFLALTEVSGATFLKQQEAVLSKTGPIVRVSVFSSGRNQNDPLVTYVVKGEEKDADVQVEASGTEEAPVFSIRSVQAR